MLPKSDAECGVRLFFRMLQVQKCASSPDFKIPAARVMIPYDDVIGAFFLVVLYGETYKNEHG